VTHFTIGTNSQRILAADLLGITTDDLKKSLQSGSTLSDLANQKGVSRSDLITSIEDGMKAAAPDGAQAPAQTQLDQTANNIADGKRPGGGAHGHHHHHGGGEPAADNASSLADTLGVSSHDLLTQLQSGDGLDSLAASRGLSTSDPLFKGLVYDNEA
jgi:hypothetical protein